MDSPGPRIYMHGACISYLVKWKIAIRFATLELVHIIIELNTSLYLTHERYGTWAWGGAGRAHWYTNGLQWTVLVLGHMVCVPGPCIAPVRLQPECIHGHIPMVSPFAFFAHSERLHVMHFLGAAAAGNDKPNSNG